MRTGSSVVRWGNPRPLARLKPTFQKNRQNNQLAHELNERAEDQMQCVEPTVIHVTPSKSRYSPQRVAGFSEKPVQVQPTLSPTESNSSLSTTATVEPRVSESIEAGSPSSFCTPGSAALEGWLFKKHAHAHLLGSQWARRCGPLKPSPFL